MSKVQVTETEQRLTNTLRTTTEALTLVTAERDALQEALQATARAEDELKVEIEHLHTVMMAAAVEISEHWDAHCDDEGYGPCNLVRRLENGFPAQYGYDAMTLVNLEKQRDEYQRAADSMAAAHKVERDALRADAERYRWLREQDDSSPLFCMYGSNGPWGECGHSDIYGELLDKSIDAALKGKA